MSKAEQDVQKLSRDFQKIQAGSLTFWPTVRRNSRDGSLLTNFDSDWDGPTELAATVEARQRLDYQQSETDLVLQVCIRRSLISRPHP